MTILLSVYVYGFLTGVKLIHTMLGFYRTSLGTPFGLSENVQHSLRIEGNVHTTEEVNMCKMLCVI